MPLARRRRTIPQAKSIPATHFCSPIRVTTGAAARFLRAEQAVEHLAYCAGLNAGLLAAALEGLDAFVFTGAIGQGSTTIRARIAERLSWLGAILDTRPTPITHG